MPRRVVQKGPAGAAGDGVDVFSAADGGGVVTRGTKRVSGSLLELESLDIALATHEENGLMSAGDKVKLDALDVGVPDNVDGAAGQLAEPQRANRVVIDGGSALSLGAVMDGQMLVRSGAAIVSAAIPASSAPYYPSVYPVPRVTPNALDDEFTSGSANLEERGWIVRQYNHATGLMAYAGPVQPYLASNPADNQYRASITPAGLMVQCGVNTSLVAYKMISGSFAASLVTALAGPSVLGATPAVYGPAFWSALPPGETTPSGVQYGHVDVEQSGKRVSVWGTSGNTVYGVEVTASPAELHAALLDWNNTAKLIHFTSIDVNSGRVRYAYGPGTFTAMAPVAVGFVVRGGFGLKSWALIRSFRVIAQGSWPGL